MIIRFLIKIYCISKILRKTKIQSIIYMLINKKYLGFTSQKITNTTFIGIRNILINYLIEEIMLCCIREYVPELF